MGIYNDVYEGHGGTYLIDPKTGKRTLLEPSTAPPAPVTQSLSLTEEDDDDVAATE